VAWSDLDSSLTHQVVQFVAMQDLHALRGKAVNLLEFCGGDSARNKSNQFKVTDSEIEVSKCRCPSICCLRQASAGVHLTASE
jgi:hypothetical protein